MHKRTKEEFVLEAAKIHGNEYDYSLVDYVNSRTPVKIICKKHGIFEQKPQHHIVGKCKCPKCSNKLKGPNRKNSLQVFITKASKLHNNKYLYEYCNYVNHKTKVKIVCPVHGEFLQTPRQHLLGHGCRKCKNEYNGKLRTKPLQEFVTRSNCVHHNKYDYSKVDYTITKSKVIIICPTHGEFEQLAESHVAGYGCPQCGVGGLYNESFFKKFPQERDSVGILYLMKIVGPDEKFLKIGITKNSVDIRRTHIKQYNATSISTVTIPLYDAYILEQELLAFFAQHSITPHFKFGGHTECISYDVVEQIKEIFNTIKNNSLIHQKPKFQI